MHYYKSLIFLWTNLLYSDDLLLLLPLDQLKIESVNLVLLTIGDK